MTPMTRPSRTLSHISLQPSEQGRKEEEQKVDGRLEAEDGGDEVGVDVGVELGGHPLAQGRPHDPRRHRLAAQLPEDLRQLLPPILLPPHCLLYSVLMQRLPLEDDGPEEELVEGPLKLGRPVPPGRVPRVDAVREAPREALDEGGDVAEAQLFRLPHQERPDEAVPRLSPSSFVVHYRPM